MSSAASFFLVNSNMLGFLSERKTFDCESQYQLPHVLPALNLWEFCCSSHNKWSGSMAKWRAAGEKSSVWVDRKVLCKWMYGPKRTKASDSQSEAVLHYYSVRVDTERSSSIRDLHTWLASPLQSLATHTTHILSVNGSTVLLDRCSR